MDQRGGGRVLLTLFQQSYKVLKKKFFKICYNKHDPTLLDRFPCYWVEKPGLEKPRILEDLSPPDREVCGFLTSPGAVFNTVDLIKNVYHHKFLKAHIGICFCLYLALLVCSVGLDSHVLSLSCADMVLDAEKRRKLVELVSRHKAALADVGASTPAGTPPAATSSPISPDTTPIDHRQKGVVEAITSEDEDTCTCLVFKRKRVVDVAAPSHSASDGRAPSFKENPPSASSPRNLVVLEGGGERPWR